MRIGSSWTDERIELVKRLWSEGYTATEIGVELGVSRNSVVGKVWRLGLRHEPREKKPASPRMKKQVNRFNFTAVKPRAPQAPRWRHLDVLPDVLPPVGGGATLDKRKGCKAVVSAEFTHPALYCDNPFHADSPYCEGHFYRYYQPPRPHRAKAPIPRIR